MRVDLFDFNLPRAHRAGARVPREAARLLVVGADGALTDARISDLPNYLKPGDALVINDTRVIAARLDGARVRGEAVAGIEATLIKRVDASRWQALVRPPRSSRSASTFALARQAKAMPAPRLAGRGGGGKGEAGEVLLSFAFSGAALDEAIDRLDKRRCRPISLPAGRRESRPR